MLVDFVEFGVLEVLYVFNVAVDVLTHVAQVDVVLDQHDLLVFDLVLRFYFAVPPLCALVLGVLLLARLAVGLHVRVARLVDLLELAAACFHHRLGALAAALVTRDLHGRLGRLVRVGVGVGGGVLVVWEHHVDALPSHGTLVLLLLLLILGVALEEAQVRVLAEKHGVGDAVVDGVAGGFSALDVAQVLVAMGPRLELDDLARRVLDLQIVDDGLPLRPVARLELHQLRVLLRRSLVGCELHLVLLEHQLVVHVQVVVVLDHVVVLLDEAAGVRDRDARGLVVVVLTATLDLLEAALELVVLVHLLQVDGHVLDLVRLLQRVAELLVVTIRHELLVVQVELWRSLVLLELLEVGLGDDDLGLLFADLVAVDRRLLLAQLILLLFRDPLRRCGVNGLLLRDLIRIQSHHGSS